MMCGQGLLEYEMISVVCKLLRKCVGAGTQEIESAW